MPLNMNTAETTPLPVSFSQLPAEIPAFVHCASAALPAAGAWSAQTAWGVPAGISEITFFITYTRGAAGGYPVFCVELGAGGVLSLEQWEDDNPAITDPIGIGSLYDHVRDVRGLHPAGAAAVSRAITVTIPRGVTSIALRAAEAGVVATPGTCAIVAVAGSNR
jgi:hypothetical protein